jgi:hypothetical protein
MPQRQCTATTLAGMPCRAPALPTEDLCFTHSPTVAAERAARNHLGGRNKDNAVRAAKTWVTAGRKVPIKDLPALMLGMASAVAAGDLEPARASAIAQLVKTALAIETHVTWDERLEKLEEMATQFGVPEASGGPGVGRKGKR